MNPLRILHASEEPVFNLGGVGKIVQWLVRDLSRLHRISLAAPDAESPDIPAAQLAGIEERIAIPRKKWDAASKRQFLQRIETGRYDFVHFHGGTFCFDAHLPWRSPMHALCRARVPWMLSNHCAPSLTEGLFQPGYPPAARFFKSLLAWKSKAALLLFCRQEVFDSDENRGHIRRWFPWARGKMRTIYHSGLEGDPPRPAFPAEVVTIGNLGHIGERKGQYDLLLAFARARQTFSRLQLVLAGPYDEREEFPRRLREEIRRRGLESAVQMPGGVEDPRVFWEKVDVYVQPSHYEGAPMALMEALWHGKPTIGTRVSGIPEIIRDGVNGLLVPSRNPEQLAAAIARLVAEPDTRRRFAENASAHIIAQGMTRARMSQRYEALYAELFPDR